MSEENAHISDGGLRRYLERTSSPGELLTADQHLAECGQCYARMIDIQPPMEFADAALFETDPAVDEHLSYENLEGYVDGRISDVDREIVDVHRAVCSYCSDQLRELIELKGSLSASPTSAAMPTTVPVSGWWQGLPLKFAVPVFALVLLGIAGGVWFLGSSRHDMTAGVPEQPANNDPVENVSSDLPGDIAIGNSKTDANTINNNESDPLMTLVDGGSRIGIDEAGKVVGLNDPRFESRVKAALSDQSIQVSTAARELKTKAGVLMGDNDSGVSFRLTEPVGKIVVSTAPQLRWQELAGAESYVVTVFDSNFNKVAESPSVNRPAWTVTTRLKPGSTYQWQVKAIKDGKEFTAPVRPAPDARFKVLDPASATEIAAAKRSHARSHLVMGIVYANAGLLDEAEREFRALLAQNPKSPAAKRLLQKVRAAR